MWDVASNYKAVNATRKSLGENIRHKEEEMTREKSFFLKEPIMIMNNNFASICDHFPYNFTFKYYLPRY